MKRTGFWATVRKEIARQQRLQHQQALKAAGGTVYFIRSGKDGPVKIGWTGGHVENRLRALQTANSQQLRIVGVFPGRTQAQERQLHAQLHGFRLQGEWFMPEVLDLLDGTERWRPTECAYPRDATRPGVLVDPSARRPPPFDRQQESLTVVCPECRAQPGEPCRTWLGNRIRKAHAGRAHEAWKRWMAVDPRKRGRVDSHGRYQGDPPHHQQEDTSEA